MAGADGRRDVRVPRQGARRHGQPPTATCSSSASSSTPSKKVRALSHGNRQKVQLIAAFASRADLLILDEPTGGLDPLMEVAFRETVLEAKERGQTVFLSSHILSEVEALCDRVGILRAGPARRRRARSPSYATCSAQTVEVTFDGPRARAPAASRRRRSPQAGANTLRFEVTGSVGPLIAALAGHPVVSLSSREPSLEEIFLHHYESGGRPWPRARAIARRAFADARARTISFAAALRVRGARAGDGVPRRLPDARRARCGSRAPSATTAPRGCSTARRTTCSRSGGYVSWRVGGSASRSSPRSGGCSAPSARCARRRTPAGPSSCSPAVVGRRTAVPRAARRDRRRRRRALARALRGLLAGRLPAGGSAYLALAIVSVRAGVRRRRRAGEPARADQARGDGARRPACSRSPSCVRAVADALVGRGSAGCAGRPRSAGSRSCGPFADPQPLVLLLPALRRPRCCSSRRRCSRTRRDIGRGLLPARDSAPPRLRLLGSPTAQALRSERGSLLALARSASAPSRC